MKNRILPAVTAMFLTYIVYLKYGEKYGLSLEWLWYSAALLVLVIVISSIFDANANPYLLGIILVGALGYITMYLYNMGFRGVNIPAWVFLAMGLLGGAAYVIEKRN